MAESFLEFLDDEFWEASLAEGWQPMSDRAAEWCVLKIKEAHARVTTKEAERAEVIKTLDAYVEKETRAARFDEARLTAKLHGYLLRLRDEGRLGRQKGYDLPSGRLQLRSVKDKYEPQDKAALLAWAEAHGYVRFEAKVDMEMVHQAIAEGVEVPGMVLVRQAGETFSVVFEKRNESDEKGGVA